MAAINTITLTLTRGPDRCTATVSAATRPSVTVEAPTFDELIDRIQETPEWQAFDIDGGPATVS